MPRAAQSAALSTCCSSTCMICHGSQSSADISNGAVHICPLTLQMFMLCTSSFITSGAASAMDCAAAAMYAGVHRFAGDSPKYLHANSHADHVWFCAVGAGSGITLLTALGNKEPSDRYVPTVDGEQWQSSACTVRSLVLLKGTW
jgi:hypothetical protein